MVNMGGLRSGWFLWSPAHLVMIPRAIPACKRDEDEGAAAHAGGDCFDPASGRTLHRWSSLPLQWIRFGMYRYVLVAPLVWSTCSEDSACTSTFVFPRRPVHMNKFDSLSTSSVGNIFPLYFTAVARRVSSPDPLSSVVL
ncbi:hypothetical protein S40285_10679 [Stachybotrys chlorohalonatus IBT 40285]|uniref:Uncharacterized protein n=1 Tax=Stachybotrys chlorohalonatus (strain IBT 40285) TaxID=1283841 RepID=A0A084QKN6_STAC4|nr:hypothetical protein S40285_10679 [Stachybotrys chlorohalonata IBT 40285]